MVHIAIEDDGVGFDVENPPAVGGRRGLGLVGIRERVTHLGGTLRITRGAPGTHIEVDLPARARTVTDAAVVRSTSSMTDPLTAEGSE